MSPMAEAGSIVRCDACPVLCRIREGKAGACDRYANLDGKAGAGRSAGRDRAGRRQGAVPRWGGRLGRRPGQERRELRHRHRRRHHLSRLQAGAVHRRRRGRRRRHGDRGLRGHLQLLRPEGEDRHRSLSRTRAGRGARRRRADRPRHHRRVRLADAGARRRPPPHGRQQARGHRHLPLDARPLLAQAGRGRDRGRRQGDPAGGRGAGRQRRARGADAGRLRLGDDRHLRPAVARPRR